MEILDKTKILSRLCKETKKYGMYIAFSDDLYQEKYDPWVEIKKAAPYLAEDCDQILTDGEAWLLFDDKEDMWNHYNRTVGDDGPTKLNPYNGPAGIYALTCNPHGQFETENT